MQYSMLAPRLMQAVFYSLHAPELREEGAVASRGCGWEQGPERPVHSVLEGEYIPAGVLAPITWVNIH